MQPEEEIPEGQISLSGDAIMQKLAEQISQQAFAIATKDVYIETLQTKLQEAEGIIARLAEQAGEVATDADKERPTRPSR